jgi:hypothetical protein
MVWLADIWKPELPPLKSNSVGVVVPAYVELLSTIEALSTYRPSVVVLALKVTLILVALAVIAPAAITVLIVYPVYPKVDPVRFCEYIADHLSPELLDKLELDELIELLELELCTASMLSVTGIPASVTPAPLLVTLYAQGISALLELEDDEREELDELLELLELDTATSQEPTSSFGAGLAPWVETTHPVRGGVVRTLVQ